MWIESLTLLALLKHIQLAKCGTLPREQFIKSLGSHMSYFIHSIEGVQRLRDVTLCMSKLM